MGAVIRALNWVNGTTVAGLAVAHASRCTVASRDGCYEAIGYTHRYPLAGAFTIGSVVIARDRLDDRVWRHELGHVRQYAWCGPMFLPLYGLAAGWSWVRCGDWWSRNIFERRAGLAAGGYVERPVRRRVAWRRGGSAVAAAAS